MGAVRIPVHVHTCASVHTSDSHSIPAHPKPSPAFLFQRPGPLPCRDCLIHLVQATWAPSPGLRHRSLSPYGGAPCAGAWMAPSQSCRGRRAPALDGKGLTCRIPGGIRGHSRDLRSNNSTGAGHPLDAGTAGSRWALRHSGSLGGGSSRQPCDIPRLGHGGKTPPSPLHPRVLRRAGGRRQTQAPPRACIPARNAGRALSPARCPLPAAPRPYQTEP